MDDYITGVEQVGADPTAAVETVASVDTKEKVDPVTDVDEFKEYDLKEYDNKAEKIHDYGDYYDFGLTGAKPTPTAYEEEFGPGVPAETDFRESSVSGAGVGWMWWGQGGLKVNGQECGEDTGGMMLDGLFSQCPFCLLFLIVSASSFCMHMHSRQIHQEAQTRIVYPCLE